MGRKKKDVDDAFFAEFDTIDEDGNSNEPTVAGVAPGNAFACCGDVYTHVYVFLSFMDC